MERKLSDEAIAIVASNLTVAFMASGIQRVDPADPRHTILAIFWDFCAELEEAQRR